MTTALIPCPDCGTSIPVDPRQLVLGVRFSCPQCPSLSIGMEVGSRSQVADALDRLDEVRRGAGQERR